MKRFDLLLPLRLRRIYTKLLDGMYCDDAHYPCMQRVGLLLVEVEREIGTARLKAVMRKVDRVTTRAKD